MLNSQNDLVIDGESLYFTDLQTLHSDSNSSVLMRTPLPMLSICELSQDGNGVYTIDGDPAGASVEPVRILDYGKPDPWHAPNGVALTRKGDIVLAITDLSDPHFDVFNGTLPASHLESVYKIQGENTDFPALNDGVTYSPELDVIFESGPGGVYLYNGTTLYLIGFF